MNHKKQISIHEKFHESTKVQKKIISPNSFTYKKILKLISAYITPNMRVLDVGCGSGTLSFYLVSKGNKVLGIDISDKAIKSCRQSAKLMNLQNRIEFVTMQFPKVIPNRKFDAVLLIEVIEHLLDDKEVLQKLYQLLHKDGIVIITTPSKNAPLYRLKLADEFDKKVGHIRRYTQEELRRKAIKAGFKILREEKNEGIVRNFLFLNPIAGKSVRFIKYFMVDFITLIDDLTCKLFGESNLFIVLKK